MAHRQEPYPGPTLCLRSLDACAGRQDCVAGHQTTAQAPCNRKATPSRLLPLLPHWPSSTHHVFGMLIIATTTSAALEGTGAMERTTGRLASSLSCLQHFVMLTTMQVNGTGSLPRVRP